MKSKVTQELLDYLNDSTRIINQPRDFTINETKRIIDIVENELIGNDVNEKILKFRSCPWTDCEIKSKSVKNFLKEMITRVRPEDNLKLSRWQVIELVELAENELSDN